MLILSKLAEERECKFDDSTLIIEITRLRDGYLKELEIKKAEWIRQVSYVVCMNKYIPTTFKINLQNMN